MSARAVLFDLDDTLFDHRGCSRDALASVQNSHDALGAMALDDLETEFPGQFSMPIPRGRWDMNRKFVEQVAPNASAYVEHIEFVPEDAGNL